MYVRTSVTQIAALKCHMPTLFAHCSISSTYRQSFVHPGYQLPFSRCFSMKVRLFQYHFRSAGRRSQGMQFVRQQQQMVQKSSIKTKVERIES